jgi:Protein of unknown function (DUF2946)
MAAPGRTGFGRPTVLIRSYNQHVAHTPSSRPLWARLAAWLGFLAVFSALLAPVSMLAQEVSSGKLGELCSVGAPAAGAGALDASGTDDTSSTAMHCDLCGSLGLGLPPLPQADVFPAAVAAMAAVFQDAVLSASSPGLPFSRGPPAL